MSFQLFGPHFPDSFRMRPILLVGGAPRVQIDRIRYMTASASGRTAMALKQLLGDKGLHADLILSIDSEEAPAQRYTTRAQLDDLLGAWIVAHRDGVVVMSAAVNDYQLNRVERLDGGTVERYGLDDKVPSGGDEFVVRLKSADKLIDQFRPRWGLQGPIVAFKYEDAATVVQEAQNLLKRVSAALVVANSVCGTVQALVEPGGVERMSDRQRLLQRLAERIKELSNR
jgi:phosphopantothenoylcysteine synthetase/decarboxylase